jgi:Ala-tRNA(Pro) deacylase
MTIAASVQKHLSRESIPYAVVEHVKTLDSAHTAEAAHIPGARLAKGTVLKDDRGYLLAIVPASRRVDLGAVHRHFGRPLGLATEVEVTTLFADCEPGAVPPLGAAYGIACVIDDSLMETPEVYFEAGDHRGLVRVSGTDFRKLVEDAEHAAISRPAF